MDNRERAREWLSAHYDNDTGEYFVAENDDSLAALLDEVAGEARAAIEGEPTTARRCSVCGAERSHGWETLTHDREKRYQEWIGHVVALAQPVSEGRLRELAAKWREMASQPGPPTKSNSTIGQLAGVAMMAAGKGVYAKCAAELERELESA